MKKWIEKDRGWDDNTMLPFLVVFGSLYALGVVLQAPLKWLDFRSKHIQIDVCDCPRCRKYGEKNG